MLAVVLSTLVVFTLWFLYMRYRARRSDRMVSYSVAADEIRDEERAAEKEE